MSALDNIQEIIQKNAWETLAEEPYSIFEVFLTMDSSSLVWSREFVFDYILDKTYFGGEIDKATASLSNGKAATALGMIIAIKVAQLNFNQDEWKLYYHKIHAMGYTMSNVMQRQLANPYLNNIEFYRLCLDFSEYMKIYGHFSQYHLPQGFLIPSASMIASFSDKEKQQFLNNLLDYSKKIQIGWRNGKSEDFYLFFKDEETALEWIYQNYTLPDFNNQFKFHGSIKTLLQHVQPQIYEKFMFDKVNSPDFVEKDIYHLMKYYEENDKISVSDDFVEKVIKIPIDSIQEYQKSKWVLEPLGNVMDKEQLDKFAKEIGATVIFKSKKLTLDEKVDLTDKNDIEPYRTDLVSDEQFYTEEEILKHFKFFPVYSLKWQRHLFISSDNYKKLKQLQEMGRGGPRYKKGWSSFEVLTRQLMSRNKLTKNIFTYLAKKTKVSAEKMAVTIEGFSPDYLHDNNMKTINVFFNRFK